MPAHLRVSAHERHLHDKGALNAIAAAAITKQPPPHLRVGAHEGHLHGEEAAVRHHAAAQECGVSQLEIYHLWQSEPPHVVLAHATWAV